MTQTIKFLTLVPILLLMSLMSRANSTDTNMTEAEQQAMFLQQMLNSPETNVIFQQQKELMPKMLQFMKQFESCLQSASSQKQADQCVEESTKYSEQLGLDEDFSEDEGPLIWDKDTKQQVLSEFKDNIQLIEQAIPCIEKAENMMDIMECHKDM